MTAKRKLVVRFNQWYDPAMEARFAREPDIELRTVEREGDQDLVWPHLSQAHAFQVSSAKDELPSIWFVTESLLARCPNLLCVSSNGAGYDTVDVAACTRAGVLVRQSGRRQCAIGCGACHRHDARCHPPHHAERPLCVPSAGTPREDSWAAR